MGDVTVTEDGFVVNAALVARAFGLAPGLVREEMRAGRINTRCETGAGEDEGRWRVTFVRDGRALRLVVNGTGDVLSRSTFPVGPVRGRSDTS